MKASDGVKDRFIEHGIIYALISMNQPDLVKKGLTDPSDDIKKAALIALDQMQNRSLKQNKSPLSWRAIITRWKALLVG